ncbi:hypothetical protein [Agrobacterium tumefaciens]|uniref:Fe/B12 periplasmic-binding domain-containing protein n=1 Tax=Agrobacterium tumefaciens TaxID=358 RepID=A0AAP9EAQ9_AGRTU|nr:hypothetical protein [Agrobacterium tumefaciens]NSZ60154.1 hypothetical protein [Agrobacterium tumefaciens]QDY97749.1 hypothetical protein CG010_026805 [Agrobacterium tumefaciens]UXS12596.1 hypothetical protein FY155_24945 [Agrobacterium tumefaciens]UXS19957.1 hypothetical protein FY154_24945 [Agrobacterium tumefaciens]UXS27605.1 hypothetical protein FY153_25780 [Agrobacterium tumefaciens]
MLQILRSSESSSFAQGPFKIRRIRPGAILGRNADPAFGPFSVMDHANLDVGTVVSMHEHGRTLTFGKTPSRAVADGQNSAEVFYLLGLGDKVVGSALWIGPVLEGFEEVDARVPRIAELDPSFEGILATKPDFIATPMADRSGGRGRHGRTVRGVGDSGLYGAG